MRSLLICLILSAPAVADEWKWAVTEVEVAQAPARKPIPRVVLVSLPNKQCKPCEELKPKLAFLKNRKDVVYVIEDLAKWNARVPANLRVTEVPTVFTWLDQTTTKSLRHKHPIAVKSITTAIGIEPPPPVESRAGVWNPPAIVETPFAKTPKPGGLQTSPLPATGSSRHTVTDFNGDGRVNETDYRIHLRNDHGYSQSQVNAMSLGQLQAAHAAEHPNGYPSSRSRARPRRGIFRRRG